MSGPLAPGALLAALLGGLTVAGVVIAVAALRGVELPQHRPSSAGLRWGPRVQAVLSGGRAEAMSRREQLVRVGFAVALGAGLWLVTGWPVAGIAVVGILLGLPWLLGSAALVQDRIDLDRTRSCRHPT